MIPHNDNNQPPFNNNNTIIIIIIIIIISHILHSKRLQPLTFSFLFLFFFILILPFHFPHPLTQTFSSSSYQISLCEQIRAYSPSPFMPHWRRSSLLLRISIVHSQMDSCSLDVSSFLPAPFNDSSSLSCRSVWHTFDLRYSKGQDNVLTIVLSAEYTSGWVGMGFSKDGMMVGSSAMVGWMGRERAHIRQYYLRGQSSSDVVVNQGQLLGTNVPEVVVLNGAKIYLAFQVKFEAPITRQSLLFAFGASPPSHYRLTEHEDKTSILFDFSAGALSASSYPVQLKRSHGILAIFGWGVLLPVGAIFARYFRQWDPLWYYLHLAIQFLGFLIVLSSLVAGVSLYDKIHANVLAHRGLGIFVFVLLILQVVAFFLRPDKDSKVRRYWNWYHAWVGRLALFLAAVNIVIGIRVGGAGNGWKAGYGFSLAVILITVIVLEVMLWIRGSKKPADPPAFQMHPPPQ